mgnify:CR=1 FL=1
MIQQKVYIIDDDAVICDVIRELLLTVGIASETYLSAEEYLKVYNNEMRGCIISDSRMARISGFMLMDKLKAQGCEIPIIFITGCADVEMAVQGIKNGAFDFIEKPFHKQSLLETVNQALEKNTEDMRLKDVSSQNDEYINKLTIREKSVFDLLMQGESSKSIAKTLGISPRTVDVHRQHILEKFNLNSISELMARILGSAIPH